MIPKTLFMIWLGDFIPDYALYAKKAYETINTAYNVVLVHFTIKNINEIFECRKYDLKYGKQLKSAIQHILEYNKSPYAKLISAQKKLYGRNIKFIQLLGDILRMEILNEYGGIYVDCDTFPVKPFDDGVISKSFIAQHDYKIGYGRNAKYVKYIDNYFVGMAPCCGFYDLEDPRLTRIECDTRVKEFDASYIHRRKLFYTCKLQNKDMFNIPKAQYIEHYFSNIWKKNGIKIPTCRFENALTESIDETAFV